ncbi:hypothetical protein QR680_017618 [Steinernema hermaphroditum]|uniref:IkappaB kinase n=1 Tax=Steinernema hermaphroditum TaxID=289476 RepID=A0AA39HHM4_9BILA|nr:hypothetical protein QR680_017618 [Steinernema hermaphroditum]
MATSPWYRIGNYHYRSHEKLGQGQFGTVYKGRSRIDGDYVAIKLLSAEPEFRSQEEIDALLTLSRNKAAYIVRLVEWLPMTGNSVALVFELADGSVQDLLHRIEFVRGFPPSLAIQLYYQISTALHFVAQDDLVHRDLKPGNVLFWNLPNNRYLFKLGDFGGARSASIDMRSLIGTVGYACEAVINNILESRVYSYSPVECEMWALASMLYQLSCGRLPFEYQKLNHSRDETQKLLESAKALSGLFANRGQRHICGVVDAKGQRVYKEQLPLSCQFSNSLRRIMESVIRDLMNSEKPTERGVIKEIFGKNLERAKELESLRPHRVFHLHEARIVDFYPTSRVSHLARSELNAPLTPLEVLGCDCEVVKLMLPSGRLVPLEELNRFEAPFDPSQLSCVAFCYDGSSEEPLRWRATKIVDDRNDSVMAKAHSTYRIADSFSALLGVPQEVSNFYGRSLEDFRVCYDAFHDHCSSVTSLLGCLKAHLSPRCMEILSPLIEQIGYLGLTVRSLSAFKPFEELLSTVRKMDYGQYDEGRIADIFESLQRKRPRDKELDELDSKMLNNVREQLLAKSDKFAKRSFEVLGAALTSESSPFEAHRKLDHFSEEIRSLCANAFDELRRQMNLREAQNGVWGAGLAALRESAEKLHKLAEQSFLDV